MQIYSGCLGSRRLFCGLKYSGMFSPRHPCNFENIPVPRTITMLMLPVNGKLLPM